MYAVLACAIQKLLERFLVRPTIQGGGGSTFASLPLIRFFFASQKLRRSYVMALFKLYREEAGVAFHEPGMTLVACKIDSHVY